MILLAIFSILLIIKDIRAYLYLKKVQKQLETTGYYDLKTNYKSNSLKYFILRYMSVFIGLFLVASFFKVWGNSLDKSDYINIQEYEEELPFSTMISFNNNVISYELDDFNIGNSFNKMLIKESLPGTTYIDYNEHATMKLSDGNYISGGLYIEYANLPNETIATILEKEMIRLAKLSKNIDTLETAPNINADSVTAYKTDTHYPGIVIRNKNKVIKVEFYQFQSSSYSIPFDDWCNIVNSSIK